MFVGSRATQLERRTHFHVLKAISGFGGNAGARNCLCDLRSRPIPPFRQPLEVAPAKRVGIRWPVREHLPSVSSIATNLPGLPVDERLPEPIASRILQVSNHAVLMLHCSIHGAAPRRRTGPQLRRVKAR
jgi:hypothetical protein